MNRIELTQVSLGVVALETVSLHTVSITESPWGEGQHFDPVAPPEPEFFQFDVTPLDSIYRLIS